MTGLEIRGLSVTYPDGFRCLDDVDLLVPDGGRVGLVGGSGCGKTTLVRAVLGLLPPGTRVTGSVRIAGREVLGLPERELRALRGTAVGYVAQDPFAACDPLRRVSAHVAEAWWAHGRRPPDGEITRRLTAVDIPEAAARAHQHPHQWSGGMLQRATTVAAGAHRPPLTLADEPTSALDADLADGLLAAVAVTSRALLLISHDLALVARHTDQLVVLAGGRVVECGPAGAVLAGPRHEVTAALVAASRPPARRSAVRPDDGWPPAADPVLQVRGVQRVYRRGRSSITAVAGVDLAVAAGEVVGVVGRSGSGKSSLLRVAGAQERPDGGQVLLAGVDPWAGVRGTPRRPPLPRPGWAMPVFQDPVAGLDRRWPLWRTITEPLTGAHPGARIGSPTGSAGRLTRAQRRERARVELDRVGLAEVDVDRRPGTLSVGQCQRVAVVRALIARPALLVADEPTASLDVESAARVAALLRSAADEGAAVLVVSHDRPRLASYADRIVTMTRGVVSDGC